MSTKEMILQATLELGAQKGLGKVSLSEIAEKVGIRKATLYSHFESKSKIIEALYAELRRRAREKVQTGPVDYEALVAGKTAKQVLHVVVQQYEKMNANEEIAAFYRFIYAERVLSKDAAAIMAAETNTMQLATRQVFYALQAHRMLKFDNLVAAANCFCFTVHGLLEFKGDLLLADMPQVADTQLNSFIDEFCKVYEWKE